MRLRQYLLGGVLLFVVLFWGVGHTADSESAALRRLLGAWEFYGHVNGKEFRDIVFVDEITVRRTIPMALGISRTGSPLAGMEREIEQRFLKQRFPDQDFPLSRYQYSISWTEPIGSIGGEERKDITLSYEFNFLSPDKVAGIVRKSDLANRKISVPTHITGHRICQHGAPCPYR